MIFLIFLMNPECQVGQYDLLMMFMMIFNDSPRFVVTFHQNFQETSKNHKIIIKKSFKKKTKFSGAKQNFWKIWKFDKSSRNI